MLTEWITTSRIAIVGALYIVITVKGYYTYAVRAQKLTHLHAVTVILVNEEFAQEREGKKKRRRICTCGFTSE